MILVPSLSDIEKNATSDAERRIARLLREVNDDLDAVAFHSVKLRTHAYKQQAEADFVVLWKKTAIVIEVKGGGIKKHDGVWYSIDRRGDWHKLATSPMEQAQSAMYALRSILRQDGVGWFAQEAAVITPDIETPPRSVEWQPTHWLGREDMSIAALTTALNKISENTQEPPSDRKIAKIEELRIRLFGQFTRMPVIDAQRGAIIEEQNRATAGQARVIASLARNPRILVHGGAGTGKSLVLAEAAKQESDQGKSVLITFRSPALRNFFAPHVTGHEIDVSPFEDLVPGKSYDVVFVDEAQDLMTPGCMDTFDQVITGGRGAGRWRMFLDMNNQAHVDGQFDRDVLELVAAEALPVDLSLNVRNTQAIVHTVQEYLGADVGDPGIVHGAKVRWRTTDSASDMAEAESVAADLVASGAHAGNIWIIRASSTAPKKITDSGITVTSPRYAKGLEAEHVIVCELPKSFDDVGTAAFYVAVTRARVSLDIVLSRADKRRVQQLVRRQLEKK
ncbi:nuclease-related domain-containing DEAD/DEAH box helicase [Amycolatopsis dendrobii]|uniref:NERD domain-containing protein/DEAD/DEAH box helicase n=1 Tax=Amycolatopsis dendrobii TaxID=2760662 RepID=A0A7W3VZ82_9PSEU|nr:NERD domain-containing protein/DEAD/DEAH box helicase [Amycolatopsis dendrobii]MBB1155948.1 NERD domain-containing protein/DEAD/DEAH box helicase [Amycolatopsis dendrobii]